MKLKKEYKKILKEIKTNNLAVEDLQNKKEEDEKSFRLEELHKIGLLGLTENSRELDKIILGLSVGSLGFLLNFFITDYSFSLDKYNISIYIFICSIILFTYTIGCVLKVFYINNEYFKKIIEYRDGSNTCDIETLEKEMGSYDNKVKFSFFFSIIISALFIITISINKEMKMTHVEKNQITKENNNGK